uniref:SIR2_2 domain-containing protein n=1 Tax=Steinernema glaseri TaxID=37863 RepID=A0A1I8AFV0_9BILA
MGASVSSFPARPEGYNVFSMTLRSPDTIKLMDAPDSVLQLVRDSLVTYYGEVQDIQRDVEGGTCFQLFGWPFAKNCGFDQTVQSKYFLTRMVADLYGTGWKLWLNSDLSRLYDNSTLFFHRVTPPSASFTMSCLSISQSDKFQLINAPESLYQALTTAVGSLRQSSDVADNCYVLKMHGNLWDNNNYEESTEARLLLLNVFRSFRREGYSFFGTVNTKGTADSIFFIRMDTSLPSEGYCIVSLNSDDRLRLIECPEPLIQMTETLLSTRWPGGIQKINREGACVEFKMTGYPWRARTREDAVTTRLFLTELLKEGVAMGWAVLAALDISRKVQDKAIFIMRSCTPARIPHFCISPGDNDKIRIIGADAEVRGYVADVIRQCWTPGIQDESIGPLHDHQLKLCGTPWQCSSSSDSFSLARLMMTRILTALEAIGWSVICSADVSAKYITERNYHNRRNNRHPQYIEYGEDVHTWFIAQISAFSTTPSQAAPSAPTEPDAPPSYNEVVGGQYAS